jgi:hypothetical protein
VKITTTNLNRGPVSLIFPCSSHNQYGKLFLIEFHHLKKAKTNTRRDFK